MLLQDVVAWPCATDKSDSFVPVDARVATAVVVLSLLPLFGRVRATGVTAGLIRDLLDEAGTGVEDVAEVLSSAVLLCPGFVTTVASSDSELLSTFKKYI